MGRLYICACSSEPLDTYSLIVYVVSTKNRIYSVDLKVNNVNTPFGTFSSQFEMWGGKFDFGTYHIKKH